MSIEIDKLKQILVSNGIAQSKDFLGCTKTEIEQISASQKVSTLPRVYMEFLRQMGKRAGQFLVGTDVYYPEVLLLKQYAFDLLGENGNPFEIPTNSFVFSMHQGYQFDYFEVNISDDPPVSFYCEPAHGPERLSMTFSEFLIKCAEDQARAEKRKKAT